MIPETELPIILSRAVIHPMRAQAIRDLAAELIEEGLDAPELHDIAWDTIIETAEARNLFTQALPKIGWRLPSRDEAVQILLHHYSSSMAHSGAPLIATFEIMCREVIRPEIDRFDHSLHAGVVHDMDTLVSDWYHYDDLADRGFPVEEMPAFLDTLRSNVAARLSRHPTAPSLLIAK